LRVTISGVTKGYAFFIDVSSSRLVIASAAGKTLTENNVKVVRIPEKKIVV
jgi:hypothetical protein